MSNLRAFSGYQQTSVVGLSAVGQVVALYERMLRDFRRALEANERSEIENRVNEANHALQILAELYRVPWTSRMVEKLQNASTISITSAAWKFSRYAWPLPAKAFNA